MHTCDNPPCVHPAHLRLGTHADNVADKVAKCRQARGERIGAARLTEADVFVIRARLGSGETQVSIAEDYDVSRSTIAAIKTRRNWGWL